MKSHKASFLLKEMNKNHYPLKTRLFLMIRQDMPKIKSIWLINTVKISGIQTLLIADQLFIAEPILADFNINQIRFNQILPKMSRLQSIWRLHRKVCLIHLLQPSKTLKYLQIRKLLNPMSIRHHFLQLRP